MALQIGLLGPVEVRIDGARIDLRGEQQRRLLGYLALTPGGVRNVDGIVEALWPSDDVDVDHRPTLYTYASRLRTALGSDAVVARDGGYSLDVPRDDIDAWRFETLIAATRHCSPDEAIGLLSEALMLWRGPALDGFAAEEWARSDAVRLDELHASASDDRAKALIALGRAEDAIADLEAATTASPLREQTHALLMRALADCGRLGEALRVFQRYRRRLATDLGLEPSSEIRRLESELASSDRSDPQPEQLLRGYALHERIGDGAFAEVYRGVQPVVGRDVAVKVIRAELANRPEFIRRFETEAQLVARLEHPFIVPLYDYWREPGKAYLVMRLLRGGTLEQRLVDGALSAAEANRMVSQVGAALVVAHHSGVVHRDVKSANVFLDGEGNFFLGDFGIALDVSAAHEPADSLSFGSPAYASPEQLRREPVGPPADVHGLGVTLFEALTGGLPFPDARSHADLLRHQLNDPLPRVTARRPDLPHEIDAVLAKATAKDPALRYPTVEEFVAAMNSAITGTLPVARVGTATVIGELRNPYKGLQAFQEADAPDFHGRQRLVDRLVEQLDAHKERFVTVVGPSGSGKSSVVRAGLVPAVRAGRIDGSQRWFVTSMMPGSHPFEELESGLNRIATAPTTGLAELMATDVRGIARAVKQACPVDGGEVLLLLDQFEELFTLCTDDAMRRSFIAGLVAAVSEPRSRLRVVATLRADFYDRPLRYPELAPLIERSAITVAPLAADELERAITEPAARVGAAFEPGLVARIAADVVDQPGSLPLMQYAMTELFDRNVSGLMSVRAYEELGGLSGALARRAEDVYTGLSSDEQDAAQRMFTRLVTLGEGTEDTRRRVRRSEFAPMGNATDRAIEAFGAARLLAFDRDPATREPTVEVAHEALIREWPRLRSWLDDDRDGLRVHRHVTVAAAAWDASGRDAGELYRGGRLETVEQWSVAHDAELNVQEREFVTASVEQRHLAAAAERRSRRRIHRALVAIAVVALVALVAGGLAWRQQREATSARDRAERTAYQAETARLAASAPEIAEQTDLAAGWLVAAEAYRRARTPETLGGLQRTLLATDRVLGFLGVPNDYRATAIDGGVVYGLRKGWIDRWELDSRRPLESIRLPDRDLDVAADDDGTAQVISAAAGVTAVTFADNSGVIVDTSTGKLREIPAQRIVVAPDGSRLLVVEPDREVQMVEFPSMRTLWTAPAFTELMLVRDQFAALGGSNEAWLKWPVRADAVFLPSGDVVVSWGLRLYRFAGADGTLLAQGGGRLLFDPASASHYGLSGRLSLDQQGRIFSWAELGASIWDPVTLELISEQFVFRLGLSSYFDHTIVPLADGRWAVVTPIAELAILDPAKPKRTMPPIEAMASAKWDEVIAEQVGEAHGMATDIARTIGAVAGEFGIALVGLDGRRPLARAIPRTEDINLPWVTVVGDETFVVMRSSSISQAGTDTLWRCPRTGECARVPGPWDASSSDALEIYWAALTWTQIAADGHTTTQIFSLPDLRKQIEIEQAAPWTFLNCCPRLVPEVGWYAALEVDNPPTQNFLTVWGVPDGARRLRRDLGTAALSAFNTPDGTIFGTIEHIYGQTTGSGRIRLYDTTTWEEIPSDLAPDAFVCCPGFNADGSLVATSDIQGNVTIRDGHTFKSTGRQLNGRAYGELVFSVDGRYLVSDDDARVWDLQTGEALGRSFPRTSGTYSFVDSADAALVTAFGRYVYVWNVHPDTWFDEACKAAGRNMTLEEWDKYGPRDEPYQATCPQWPSAA